MAAPTGLSGRLVTPQDFGAAAIGVPFKDHGRAFDGWDCYGLVCVAYREVLGIELPTYDGEYLTANDRGEVEGLVLSGKQAWERIVYPTEMSVVSLRVQNRECHLGLVLGSRHMLHVHAGIETCLERVDGTRWAHRIEGFYRHAGQG